MTKQEFIKSVEKKPKGELVYRKSSNNYDMKVVFTNLSTKQKQWFKVKKWDKQGKGKLEVVWSYQSGNIADIVSEIEEGI